MDKIDSFATGVLSMLAIAVSINLLVKRSKKSDLVKNITELAKNQDTPALVDMIVLP